MSQPRILAAVNAVIKDGEKTVDYLKDDEVAPKHVKQLEQAGALVPLKDEPLTEHDNTGN